MKFGHGPLDLGGVDLEAVTPGQQLREFARVARGLGPSRAALEPIRLRASLFKPPVGAVSFDIFDTLMNVSMTPPEAIWHELGRRVEKETRLDPRAFVDLRNAGFRSLKAAGAAVTLESVYQYVERMLARPDLGRTLANAEMNLIAQLLQPIGHGRRLLSFVRSEHQLPAWFVSDMHLPAAFLREQLERFDLWQRGDVLWVSGEAGTGKRDGLLFRHVAENARSSGVEGSLVHIGDDILADVVSARRAGWRAQRVTYGILSRYEQILARASSTNDSSLFAFLAGVARQARLTCDASQDERSKALRGVALGVAAPLFVLYGLWLLSRARVLGLTRLYFVSRDGEILSEITARLATALSLPVECRYLYGGRAAWQLPALAAVDDGGAAIMALVDRETTRYSIVHLSTIAKRFGLNAADLSSRLGLEPPGDDEQELALADRELVRTFLRSSTGRNLIHAAADRDLDICLRYLQQEGLFADDNWAMVDVGWRGNTADALNTLLRSGGRQPCRTMFIGYLGDPNDPPPRCEAFLWDTRRKNAPGPPPGAVSVVEGLTSGTHGTVTGYVLNQYGVIEPLFHAEQSVAQRYWPLTNFRAEIDTFMDRLTPLVRSEWLDVDSRIPATDVLAELCQQGSKAEARAVGSCPREEDALGDCVYPIARGFKFRDIPMFFSRKTVVARNMAWPRGALLSTLAPKRFIFGALIELVGQAAGVKAQIRSWRTRRFGRGT